MKVFKLQNNADHGLYSFLHDRFLHAVFLSTFRLVPLSASGMDFGYVLNRAPVVLPVECFIAHSFRAPCLDEGEGAGGLAGGRCPPPFMSSPTSAAPRLRITRLGGPGHAHACCARATSGRSLGAGRRRCEFA